METTTTETKYKDQQNRVGFLIRKKKHINKPLTKTTKRKKVKTKINLIRNENEAITTDTNEIQKITWFCL